MIKKLLLIFFFAVSMVCLWALKSFTELMNQPLMLDQASVVYEVKAGSSVNQVLKDLEYKGWLRFPKIYEYWLRYIELTNIKSGQYQLTQTMTTIQAVEVMVTGTSILHSIQFIEGFTFADYVATIRAHPEVINTTDGMSLQEIFTLATGKDSHFEGWMFPDTYFIEAGIKDVQVIEKSYKMMEKVLQKQWANKSDDTLAKTPYEALILASIIEKETGAPVERAQISGVFNRRLKKGMRLQADPTVIYGLGVDFNGNITRKDLRTDTPYNSYTRHGLPPTPIASPGEQAIWAALHPDNSDALFFVAKGDGTHYFSATLQEHNKAVVNYQRSGRRTDYQSQITQ